MWGNLHAVQSLLLALIQLEQGMAFCGEQPAFGFMRGLEPWIALLARGAFEIFFDWCRYGRPFCNFKALGALGKRCHHHRKHEKLEGSATTLAGAYSDSFCKQVAALCAGAWDTFEAQVSSSFRAGGGVQGDSSGLVEVSVDSCSVGREFRDRFQRGRQKRSSTLWAVQLSEGLCWRTFMQYRFKEKAHINLQEAKARRSLIKRLPRDKRVVLCQDSRVNLGALGKGRSPSSSLNLIMRSEAPWILGKNLYPAGVHFPTCSIRADAPSRSLPTAGPRLALPPWFWTPTA